MLTGHNIKLCGLHVQQAWCRQTAKQHGIKNYSGIGYKNTKNIQQQIPRLPGKPIRTTMYTS